jgi:hypothetical protein
MAAKSLEGFPLFKVHLLLMKRHVLKYEQEIYTDNVRARIVLDQNGVVCKADYGCGQPRDVEEEESVGSVEHLEPRMDDDDDDEFVDQESDDDTEEADGESYSDEDNGYLEDAMEHNQGKTESTAESNIEAKCNDDDINMDKDNNEDEVGGDKEDAKDKKVENWNMFMRKDGWMKQDGWVMNVERDSMEEVQKNEKGNDCDEGEEDHEEEEDNDESEDNGSSYDDDGNPLGSEHKMFRGANKQYVEPHQGNSAGSVEQWYYAAAVVVSLAKA